MKFIHSSNFRIRFGITFSRNLYTSKVWFCFLFHLKSTEEISSSEELISLNLSGKRFYILLHNLARLPLSRLGMMVSISLVNILRNTVIDKKLILWFDSKHSFGICVSFWTVFKLSQQPFELTHYARPRLQWSFEAWKYLLVKFLNMYYFNLHFSILSEINFLPITFIGSLLYTASLLFINLQFLFHVKEKIYKRV